jgi:hypothetical protein
MRAAWLPIVVVSAAAAVGCGDSGSSTPDLAAGDLSAATGGDLAQGPFCAGTAVAGTCAAIFFAPLSSCFDPTGACTEMLVGNAGSDCWANGSKLVGTISGDGGTAAHGVFSKSGTPCYTVDVAQSVAGGEVFTVTSGGHTLIYDLQQGKVSCPDSSTVLIGADYGGCAALKALIAPKTSGCTSGACS